MSKKIDREKELLPDVYSILKVVPKKSSIYTIPELCTPEYSYPAGYFYRYGQVSLDCKDSLKSDYYLIWKDKQDEITKESTKVDLNLNVFDLYKRD